MWPVRLARQPEDRRTMLPIAPVPVRASAAPPAMAARAGTEIVVRSTSRGQLLTTRGGLVLFVFSRDRRNVDRCASMPSCASVWPIISTHGRPTAGRGVRRSLLGTIHVAGKGTQVTYAGHPLYRYAPEPTPGATDYVGAHASGGVWRAIRSSGALVG